MLEKLCRKRLSPLLSGKTKIWASGIIYAIAQNNWIFERSNYYYRAAKDPVEPLGVSKSTAANKAADIRKMLKIDHFSAEWIFPSEKD